MFKNYIKIAFRSFIKDKIFSVINIAGLAIGLACTILILMWVRNELSYDQFHDKKDQIYRLTWTAKFGDRAINISSSPGKWAPEATQTIPDILKFARYRNLPRTLVKINEKSFFEQRAGMVDKDFFNLFSFPVLAGDINSAFDEPNNIAISQLFAEKAFGDQNPIGAQLELLDNIFTISAVYKDFPLNSHLQFDILGSTEYIKSVNPTFLDWYSDNVVSYLLVSENADIEEINNEIDDIILNNATNFRQFNVDITLQPLSDIYFLDNEIMNNDNEIHGSRKYAKIFTVIAVLILVIACINYTNLSTAKSEKRIREIGIRKVTGATKKRVIFQFLNESFFFTFLALILSLIIVEIILPHFNNLISKELTINYTDYKNLIPLLIIIIITSLMSGSYPALYISSLKPYEVLKGMRIIKKGMKLRIRKVLVTFQFLLSSILIFCTLVILKQYHYLKQYDLGFNMDQVIYVTANKSIWNNYLPFSEQLQKHSSIHNVAFKSCVPFIKVDGGVMQWRNNETGKLPILELAEVDYAYFNLLDISIIQGRSFSKEIRSDSLNACIINEQAAIAFGMKNPLGEIIVNNRNEEREIIGVIKNTYFKNLKDVIEPQMYVLPHPRTKKDDRNIVLIKIKNTDIETTISYIKETCNTFSPEYPCEISFLSSDYGNLYAEEKKNNILTNIFTILAIVISSLGLFGLSSYYTERRSKEIGIRKVHGASGANIFSMLFREYSRLVIISLILALPLSFFIMKRWLIAFANKIDIDVWIFVCSISIAFIIAFLSIYTQTLRISKKNPVDSLRYE